MANMVVLWEKDGKIWWTHLCYEDLLQFFYPQKWKIANKESWYKQIYGVYEQENCQDQVQR